jgi:hypothetical protein
MDAARRTLLVGLVGVAVFASVARASSYLDWTTEDIEIGLTVVYARNTLAIDTLGAPHVAYYVTGANDVRYATKVAGAWVVEVVEDSTAFDTITITAMPSLALDSQAHPHIVYVALRDGLQTLIHAVRDASGWHREVIETFSDSLADCRLVLDAFDRPHVVYSRWEASQMVLHYRVRDGAQWSDSVVAEGDQAALALDGAGSPVIVFRGWGTATWMRLQHAVPAGAGWALADMGLYGSWPDLALDRAGRVHATAKGGSSVYYLTNASGAWSFTWILQSYTDARDAPIGIDWREEPVIVCCDSLRNLRWAYHRHGAWTLEYVDPGGGGLQAVTPSLAFDATWQPRVGYYWARAIRLAVATEGHPTGIGGSTMPPVSSRTLMAQPNPFNPRTTIRFDLPAAGPVRLAVYDLAGRLVRVLVEGEIPAGSHEAVWDGRDQSGRSAPSGSYLARLVAGGKVEGVRLSLVR